MYIRHFWGFDHNLYIFNVNLDVNVLIVRACFGAQTCIHMKANTLNDIYFFGRMLYNEFLQNVHLGPKSTIIIVYVIIQHYGCVFDLQCVRCICMYNCNPQYILHSGIESLVSGICIYIHEAFLFLSIETL